jgi:protein tyrosine phosphatase type 4A
VTDVVRCCEATYAKEPLAEKGIQVHDFVFMDGEAPPAPIVDAWLQLIEQRFKNNHDAHEQEEEKSVDHEDNGRKLPCIATHCVAGLGR